MEISETPSPAGPPSPLPPTSSAEDRATIKQQDLDRVFRQTLGLVRIILVARYELEEFEALELEKELDARLRHYCRQMDVIPAAKCREFLVASACQITHDYQQYMVQTGQRRASQKLLGLLARGASAVCRDFAKNLALFEYRRFDNPPQI